MLRKRKTSARKRKRRNECPGEHVGFSSSSSSLTTQRPKISEENMEKKGETSV